MEKRIKVACECEGTGFIAVADNGGEVLSALAYQADTGSLIGNIMEAAKEIERLSSTDDLLTHIGKQTGISSEFFKSKATSAKNTHAAWVQIVGDR